MNRILPIVFALAFTLNGFSQTSYKKGYFIANNGIKTECLIKKANYADISKNISYKLSEDAKIETASLNSIKEINIYDTNKFIKRKVDIGRATPQNKDDIDFTYNAEELFFSVLVEGEASLFSQYDNGSEIFFFSVNGIELKQLVYKTWMSDNKIERKTNRFRKQLFDNLMCETISFDTANKLKYQKKDLIDFFIKFNDCKNSDATVYNKKERIFNVNLRPRVNFTSLILDETGDRLNPRSFDFGSQTTFGFGVEFEAILPFSNNKWAIALEPTYDGDLSDEFIIENDVNVDERVIVNYTSVNVPITLRHYSYINTNSKLFINASVVFDFPVNSSTIDFKIDDRISQSADPVESANFAFGVGYKFKNKYGVEVRYYTDRDIINDSGSFSTSFNQFSLIFGYTIF